MNKGEIILEVRTQRGLTRSELATMANMEVETIIRIEKHNAFMLPVKYENICLVLNFPSEAFNLILSVYDVANSNKVDLKSIIDHTIIQKVGKLYDLDFPPPGH